mgnify:FL=1
MVDEDDPTKLPHQVNTSPTPIPETVFVADGTHIIGNVHLGINSSIWYNSVIRGDINHINIGDRTNIQDGCILHVTNTNPCSIGNDVTTGHGAQLHACEIEDGCLIGMGAIILSGARIGRGSVVGAGTLIRENEDIPPLSLIVGVPSRHVRKLPPSTYQKNLDWAQKYVQLAQNYSKNC